jgi:peptidoglycan/LPS O-acetylase OafA/YrhL
MFNNNAGSLRFIAAFLVLWGHGFALSAGAHSVHDPLSDILKAYTPYSLALPGVGVALFFILSGYLITGSYLSSKKISSFLVSRVFRIFPALIVAVLFCAVIIGGGVTSLPLEDYFRNQGTWNFIFQNSILINGISFRLPGVFNDLPWKGGVNGSLWTLPIELSMYFYVAVLGLLGALGERRVFNILFIFIITLFLANPASFPFLQTPKHEYLGLSFLAGAFFRINIDILKDSFRACVVVLFLSCVVSYGHPSYNFFASCIIWLGFFCRFRMPQLDKYGDFSYGLYLYAFPFQQLSIYIFGHENPYLINLVSFLFSICMAVLSWFYIEKPAIKVKNKLLLKIG